MQNKLANAFSATHSNTQRVFSLVLGSLVPPPIRLEKDFAGAKAWSPAKRDFAPRIQIARYRWSTATIGFDKRIGGGTPCPLACGWFRKKIGEFIFIH